MTLRMMTMTATDYYIIRIILLLLLMQNIPRNVFLAAEIQGPDASGVNPQWRRDTRDGDVAPVEELVPTTPSPEIVDLKVTSASSNSKSASASKSTPGSISMEEKSFPRMAVVVEVEGLDTPANSLSSSRSQSQPDDNDSEESSNGKLNPATNKLQASFIERFLNLQNMLQELNKLTDRKQPKPVPEKELTLQEKEGWFNIYILLNTILNKINYFVFFF